MPPIHRIGKVGIRSAAQHIRFNFFKALRATLLIASVVFVLDHILHYMAPLNNTFMAVALRMSFVSSEAPWPHARDKAPVLALIDACAFQNQFARTTPLDRRTLAHVIRQLQPPAATGVPAVLAVDIDVAPTPSPQSIADPGGQDELQDALGDLLAAGTKLVLIEPTERIAPPDTTRHLKCWATCFKDPNCRKKPIASSDLDDVCSHLIQESRHHTGDLSLRFASPVLETQGGFMLHQPGCVERRWPNERRLESVGLAVAEFVRTLGKDPYTVPATCAEHGDDNHEANDRQSLLTPWAIQYLLKNQRPPPKECHAESDILTLRDEMGGTPPNGGAGRVVFLGTDSPEIDQHDILLQGAKPARLSGVAMHAATYAAIMAPVSEAEFLSFCLDIAVGLTAGLLLGPIWKYRIRHLLGALSHSAPPNWRHLVYGASLQDPGRYLKTTAYWLMNLVILVIFLVLGMLASAWGLTKGYWISGAPIVLGVYLHSLLESMEAAMEEAAGHQHHSHDPGHPPSSHAGADTRHHRLTRHAAFLIWLGVRTAQFGLPSYILLTMIWPWLYEVWHWLYEVWHWLSELHT